MAYLGTLRVLGGEISQTCFVLELNHQDYKAEAVNCARWCSAEG
jgi:hypothetical protein